MRKGMPALMGAVAIMLAVAAPARAQANCYVTELVLSQPANPASVSRIGFAWSTNLSSGLVSEADLVSLRMNLYAQPSNGPDILVYTDDVIVDGIVQPIGGEPRVVSDLFWDFELDTVLLYGVSNFGLGDLVGTSGEHYIVEDAGALPDVGELRILNAFDGATQWDVVESLQGQTTLPDLDCNGSGDVAVATSTSVTSAPNPSSIGETVVLTATVTSAEGTPTGTVLFHRGFFDFFLGQADLNPSGVATLDVVFADWGNTEILAEYLGIDMQFEPSDSPLTPHGVKAPTTTTLIPSATGFPFTSTIEITAVVDSANTADPTGSVVFKDGGAIIGSSSLASGAAVLSAQFPIGVHSLTAEYGGSDLDDPSVSPPVEVTARYDTATRVVTSPNPSVFGSESVSFTVTATSGGGTPTGNVEVLVDGVPTAAGPFPLVNGVAQGTFDRWDLFGGTRLITAQLLPNGLWEGSLSPPHEHGVTVAGSTARFDDIAPGPESTWGQEILLRVLFDLDTVSRSRDALDKGASLVTFYDGNTVLGNAPLLFELDFIAAELRTSSLGIGQHTLRALWTGDASVGPASATTPHSVFVVTRTELGASPNPALLDDTVTVTATVSSLAGPPAGLVTFYKSGVELGSATLNSAGAASIQLSESEPVSYSLSATYQGDGSRLSSSASPIVLTVNVPSLAVGLQALPASSETEPLLDVDLAGIVVGTVVGAVTYTYYCNKNDLGTLVTPDFDLQLVGAGDTVLVAADLCDYPNHGVYYPKVIVERGGLAAADLATVIVRGMPTANFVLSDATPVIHQTVQLTSTSTGPNLVHLWDTNGDGYWDRSGLGATVSYPTGGTVRARLLVYNSYGASETTRTIAVQDDTPHISSVQRRYAGFFIAGVTVVNDFTIGVNWQGVSPGTVEVRLNNGPPQSVPFVGSTADYPLNMGVLPPKLGASRVALTPISSNGTRGRTRYEYLTVLPFPDWLQTALSVGGNVSFYPGNGVITTGFQFEFPVPHIPAEGIDIPKFVPVVGGRCGINETFAQISGSLQSSGVGRLAVYGQTGIACASADIEGRIRGSGDFRISSSGLELTGATFGIGVKGTVRRSKKLRDAVPGIKTAEGYPVIGGTMKKIGQSRLTAEVSADLDLEAAFRQSRGQLIFDNGRGTLDLEVKGTVSVEIGVLRVDAWLALGGGITVAVPEPTLREARIWLEAGAEVTVDVFFVPDFDVKARYLCTWVHGGSTNCTLSVSGGLAKDGLRENVPDSFRLRLIERDYERFGEYAKFEPRSIPREKSSRLPATTQFGSVVSNMFPSARPQLTDLGGGEMLLMWIHDDLADLPAQSTEVSWSHFDGFGWTEPELIADETQAELGISTGVDSEGRVVAAWMRVADPDFDATLVGTTGDLALMETQYEIVTAAFDPLTGGWSEVSQLTADEMRDVDPRLARGPNGELLLTWISSNGDGWVSTSTGPASVRYAIWNPATAAWGPTGEVASGLVGVEFHTSAWRGDSGLVMLSRDPDETIDGDDVIEYWQWDGTAWTGPTPFAQGGFGHTRPQVQYDAVGTAHVIWLRGFELVEEGDQGPVITIDRELVWATLSDPTPRSVRGESSDVSFLNAQFLSNRNGNLTLVWQQMSDTGPADLYALIYDDENAMWSADRKLSDEPDRDTTSPSVFYGDDGVLRGAYLSTEIQRTSEMDQIGGEMVEFTNIPVRAATDLRTFAHLLVRDLAVFDAELILTPDFPEVGDTVRARIPVHNLGDFAIGPFGVGLFLGDPDQGGALQSVQVISDLLAAATSREVQFEFPWPEGGGDVFVVVDPDLQLTEITRVNNRAVKLLEGEDPVAVALANIEIGDFPLTVQFDASASFDPEGEGLQYEWIFDDDTESASGLTAVHTFDLPGEYEVRLIVTDPTGRAGVDTILIGVGPLASGSTADSLRLDRLVGGGLALTWGDSCLASDSDYAIYQGTLGDFSSHLPVACSTRSATRTEVASDGPSRYYLVVPRTIMGEGSYGLANGNGGVASPRDPSTESCAPRLVGSCGGN